MNKKFIKAYEKFKAGETKDAPKLYVEKKLSSKLGILSVEIYDRDNELVKLDGLKMAESIPMLDAHRMNDSVVDNVLGRWRSLSINTDEMGRTRLTAEPDFAETPRGKIAKTLVDGGYVDSISIGFMVNEYDIETQTILKGELLEASLVSVPANPMAGFKNLNTDETANEIEKSLSNYKRIKPVLKEYRSLFSVELAKKLEIEKTGEELVDIKSIYDRILLVVSENQNLLSTIEQYKHAENQQKALAHKKVLEQKTQELIQAVFSQKLQEKLQEE